MEGAQTNPDQLGQFLSSCLKQKKHVTDAKSKLDEEGIDYDTIFELGEEDLRSTLLDLGIKKYQVGLIVNKLRKMEGSGVKLYPLSATSSTIVVLTNEQNNYILKLSKNGDAVKQNMVALQQAVEEVHTHSKNIESEINTYYETLSKTLQQQQNTMLTQLEKIKNSKLLILKQGSVKAEKALQLLQISNIDLKKIINDKKLDITNKQVAITQHIESSQQQLLNYKMYLENNMPLSTQPKMAYEIDIDGFETFVKKMDNILDSDIHFSEITFNQHQAIIAWKSDLIKLQNNTKFELQFNQYLLSTDDGQNETWKVLQLLKPNQTEVNLYGKSNADDYDYQESSSDDEKYDNKMNEEDEFDDDLKQQNENKDIMVKGKAGALIGLTKYQFRVCVKTSNNIYSNVLVAKTPQFKRLQSNILNIDEEVQLIKWIPNSSRCSFELLFRASRDGYTSLAFHANCNDKGPTVTIIKSNYDHVFGGYTEASFNSSGGYGNDANAWLYLLRSANDSSPTKINIQNKQYAIYNHPSYGPAYGSNPDLYINNNCNSNSSCVSLGSGYISTGNNNQLAGSSSFTVSDYEVWSIEYPPSPPRNKIKSIIINSSERKQLMKWIPGSNQCKFRLLFRASRDGFEGSKFHQRCDNKGPTITIMRSTNDNVFGGYTEESWNKSNQYSYDDTAWLYSMRNKQGYGAKKFNIKNNGQQAIYGCNGHGPYYGSNPDLYINNNCDTSNSSSSLGGAYGGHSTPYQLAGSNSFKLTDYEVFEVIQPPQNIGKLKSSIVGQNEFAKLHKWIKATGNSRYKLLFRGSRDGFTASTFHQKCDGKGKTLVIVQSTNNHVFGGYTEKSWKHTGGYQSDPKAWIYLLRSSRGDKPEQWRPTKSPSNSIWTYSSYGPTFGGHDCYLANACNTNKSSYSNLGQTYSANKDKNKLAGSYKFKVTDYEVWKIS